MKIVIRLFLTIITTVLIVFSHSSVATNLSVQPIKIVMGEDTYPYQYRDENGQPAGILVDLWLEWSMVTNTPITFDVQNWTESLNSLHNGTADIHMGMAINEQRLNRFDFAKPITSLDTFLFIHKSIDRKRHLTDLIPYQIGLVDGSSHEQTLKNINPKFSFRKYPSRIELLKGASNGEILVFAGVEGYQRNVSLDLDIANEFHTSSRLPINDIALAPAVNKGNSALLAKIEQGFEQIDEAQRMRIERRWLGYNRQQAGIMIAMQSNVEPYVDIGLDGLPDGLFVDLWKLWSKKTGISIDFVIGDMNSSIEDINNGIADVHIGYPESNEMRTGLKQAWHLTTVKSRFFSTNINISNINDISHARVGVFPTAPYIAKIRQAYPDTQIRFYDSIAAMVDASERSEINGFFAESASTSHYLLTNKLWTDFKLYTNIGYTTDIYVLTRLEDSGLAERISSGFQLITPEERSRIENKWLINPNDRYFSNNEHNIMLSQQQKDYLAKLGAIKMGYLKDWRPMEFQGGNGEFLGVNSDIKSLLVKHLGLSIIPVAFDNFDQMMQQLQSGEIQIVASLAQNNTREKTIIFSEPYWPSPWAIASDMTQPTIFNVSQLAGKRLAVVQGYQLIDQFRQRYPEIDIIPVSDTLAGLNTVIDGQADMFVEKVTTLAENLKNGDYPSLKLSLIADLADQQSRIGIFSGVKELQPLVNKVLSTMDKTAQQALYQKWNDVRLNTHSKFSSKWVNYLIIGLLIVSAIALAVIIINRRLNLEIKLREAAEDRLVFIANHDNVTGLANRTLLEQQLKSSITSHKQSGDKFALLFIDLDGFKIVNDQYGHDVGDMLLAEVASVFKNAIRKTDSVARFGGDEFVIILNHIQSLQDAKRLAESLLNKLATITTIEDKPVMISASIGMAVYPNNGDSPEALLKYSDTLMYQAKRTGGRKHVHQ
ncbi:diguanylate cyclase domain-containing protein [Shewanella gaetbuli]|uniref:Transporter substrate-binding domain-containing protein n=1 Tax=Shewanella gaetbuli TaxID=220752 RepID=A0A9X1ZR69_9GAMM|nr:transporter substrate-binding domain-containing protein [Shewanella gaetbuli]MCL1142603.1 transporter substrate-binding domain-containing protein [Shewanella gaetbuli]